jgi:hypothetical protein
MPESLGARHEPSRHTRPPAQSAEVSHSGVGAGDDEPHAAKKIESRIQDRGSDMATRVARPTNRRTTSSEPDTALDTTSWFVAALASCFARPDSTDEPLYDVE